MNKKLSNRPELEKSEIVRDIPLACADESAAVDFFEKQRWGDSPACPHCNSDKVYKMQGKGGKGGRNARFLWRCRDCAEQYTVRIGTVFEDSRLPLRHWCYAFWRGSTSKKGVSALEISRHCQITYKSALFLMHRVRFALTEDTTKLPKLGSGGETIEADETYCGGKPRLYANGVKQKGTGYRKDSNKTPVVAMLERGGAVRTKVIANVTQKNLGAFLEDNIARGAVVNTDQSKVYHTILYPIIKWDNGRHDVVNHSAREYSRHNPDGTVSSTNTCESFFSLLKRGLYGTFHAVSKEHLHRYANEFSFRWNNRALNDGERTALAIKSAVGKRLAYADYSATTLPQ